MFNLSGHEPMLLGPLPEHPIAPFGGVDNDLRWMARGGGAVVGATIDMPLSFVGDIVTLPWTTYEWLNAERKHPEEKQPAVPVGDLPEQSGRFEIFPTRPNSPY